MLPTKRATKKARRRATAATIHSVTEVTPNTSRAGTAGAWIDEVHEPDKHGSRFDKCPTLLRETLTGLVSVGGSHGCSRHRSMDSEGGAESTRGARWRDRKGTRLNPSHG